MLTRIKENTETDYKSAMHRDTLQLLLLLVSAKVKHQTTRSICMMISISGIRSTAYILQSHAHPNTKFIL